MSTGEMILLHMATRQPSPVDAMVLIGGTTYFPEQARAIVRMVASYGASPAVMGHFRQCAAQGDAQVKELVRQFGGFKNSYDDMNFTAHYLGTIKAHCGWGSRRIHPGESTKSATPRSIPMKQVVRDLLTDLRGARGKSELFSRVLRLTVC